MEKIITNSIAAFCIINEIFLLILNIYLFIRALRMEMCFTKILCIFISSACLLGLFIVAMVMCKNFFGL